MFGVSQAWPRPPAPALLGWLKGIAVGSTLLVAGCAGGYSPSDLGSGFSGPAGPTAPGTTIGGGQVKVGLILPLSASGIA